MTIHCCSAIIHPLMGPLLTILKGICQVGSPFHVILRVHNVCESCSVECATIVITTEALEPLTQLE